MATVTHRQVLASSTNASTYTTTSFTPPSGELLVSFVVASGTTTTPGVMQDSTGGNWVSSRIESKNSSADKLYLFVRDIVTNGSAMTVTFDCTGDAATGAVVFIAGVSGMSRFGSSAVKQTGGQTNQAAAGTPAPTFGAACDTNNPTLGFVGNASNPAGMTPPTSWTEDASGDTGYNTPATGGEYVFRNSGFTGTTITWGGTSATAFGSIIVELDASAVPTATGGTLLTLGVG